MQTYPNIETIVICKGLERSQQRNIGIQQSNGKYIYSLDDDFFIQPRTVEESVNLLESNPTISFLCINGRFPKSQKLLHKVRRIEREINIQNPNNLAGCFFLKSILPDKPFPEDSYANEEFILHQTLLDSGHKFLVTKSYALHLGEPKSWKQLILSSIYYGKNINRYLSTKTIKTSFLNRLMNLSPIRKVYFNNLNLFTPITYTALIIYQYLRYISALVGSLI